MPFSGATEHQREYTAKQGPQLPSQGSLQRSSMVHPLFMGCTTYSHFHTGFAVAPKSPRALLAPPSCDVDLQSFADDANRTTNQLAYVPHAVTRVPGPQYVGARAQLPWLAAPSTYAEHYQEKRLPLLALVPRGQVMQMPFSGETESQAEFTPKEYRPSLPHLSGLVSGGIPLPGPRRSLGVQYWSAGRPGMHCILLPHSVPAPCSAWRVFTTVHDNEETVRWRGCNDCARAPR